MRAGSGPGNFSMMIGTAVFMALRFMYRKMTGRGFSEPIAGWMPEWEGRNMKNRSKMQADRIRGALYGVAVGDALGGPVEFMNAMTIQEKFGCVTEMIGGGWLNLKPGEITDDTQMTLCVANGILDSIEGNNGLSIPASVGQRFLVWAEGGPKDIGGACAQSISVARELGSKRPNGIPIAQDWKEAARQTRCASGRPVEGNGALMRTVYPGLYFRTAPEVEAHAREIAEMTHRGDKSTEACVLYSNMIHLLTDADSGERDETAAKFLYECLKNTSYDNAVEKPATPVTGGYVVDSMRIAVSCLAHARTFEKAVCMAANLGGDADTNAAITGGIAGAWFGFSAIPVRWVDALDPHVAEQLDILAEAAEKHRRE